MVDRHVNIKEILEDHKNIEILKLLQRNPRISIAELARKIKMSNPATKERVRRLEKSGVIAGYRLELDPKAAGHEITAFVRIRPLPGHLPKISALAQQIPEVVECHRVTGEDCFILKVHLPEIASLDRVTTFGESHGGGIGVVIDGCPPCIEISEAEIQRELDRRRPGQNKLTTQRKEEDRCELLSGVFEGRTLGTPIAILVRNKDARPEDYSEIARKFRPSHADYTYEAKYGIRNWQGGGRASARETIGRVAAGAIAKKTLSALYAHFEVDAYVTLIQEGDSKIYRCNVTE